VDRCFYARLSYPAALPHQERAAGTDAIREFEIGRRTFFDFGPPFNYYELFIVSASREGVAVKRITLTPGGTECLVPAKVEVASASISKPITELLDSVNPCAIPEKELRREQKRCKKCSVFSGAEIVMRFQCGTQKRLIRSSVLDRDWCSSSAKTPTNTLWSMTLLDRLEQAVGPGVMSKPAFSIPGDGYGTVPNLDSSMSANLSAGVYGVLFSGTEKLSQIFQSATAPDRLSPTVTLKSSVPFDPDVFVAPTIRRWHGTTLREMFLFRSKWIQTEMLSIQ
jgi:hypothetical protein